MKSTAVIGAGFGDEGKGKVVSYLCSQYKNPLVVRYCGGHQAGHHVVVKYPKNDHVFSNFGSGTLQGFDTLWSKYCTVDPVGILNERIVLMEKGVYPIFLVIDEQCPVTTPYEKVFNRKFEKSNCHGSCGVGVGQTFQREEDHHSIIMSDLYHPSVLKMKLDLLRKYYYGETNYTGLEVDDDYIENFLYCCEQLTLTDGIDTIYNMKKFLDVSERGELYDRIIFEGAQGLLLDQNFGFFPHVTRANTGTKNILEMGFEPEIMLVTRAYQTRHGNGPMTNESIPRNIKVNPYENNFDDGPQGKFRCSLLDLDLLKYAISRDRYIKEHGFSLVITCLDLLNEYSFMMDGTVFCFDNEQEFVEKIFEELDASNLYVSSSPFPELRCI